MPRNTTKPNSYRTPLRSRSDIAGRLASVGGYYSTYYAYGAEGNEGYFSGQKP